MMNKKWMVIGLLLLGSTLQAGDHDSFQDRELKEIEFFLSDYMDLDPNAIDFSYAPNTVSQNSSSINERDKRKRTPSPLPLELPKIDFEKLNHLYNEYNQSQNKQTPTDLDSNTIASSSASTLPITPQTLITTDIQKQQNKKQKTSIFSRDKKTGLECPYCKEAEEDIQEIFSVNEQEQLIAHIKKNHAGEKAHICPYRKCDTRFTCNIYLTRHIRAHTGEKPYQCTDCDMSFSLSQNLTKHKTTHTRERAYQCIYTGCNMEFSRRHTLTNHTRIHTGERPYQCTHTGCNMAFSRRDTLTKHTRSHTGERPYQCTPCSKAFTSSSDLTTHKKSKKHKNKKQAIDDDLMNAPSNNAPTTTSARSALTSIGLDEEGNDE